MDAPASREYLLSVGGTQSDVGVRRAKKRLLEAASERQWLRGVGIGRVDSEVGLIISVKPTAKGAATRVINKLGLGVPFEIRGVTGVRKSPAARRAGAGRVVEELRAEAQRRMKR
jgi:hypothetical protein